MASLDSHLKASGETQAEFALRIGVRQGTVSKLARRLMVPSLKLAQRIERATNGGVPVNSWDAEDPVGQVPATHNTMAISANNPNQECSHDNPSEDRASDAA